MKSVRVIKEYGSLVSIGVGDKQRPDKCPCQVFLCSRPNVMPYVGGSVLIKAQSSIE